MEVKVTYPHVERRKKGRRKMLQILKWPFIVGALASIIVNICVGGKAWSAIVVAGEIALWKLVFALDLVEYNRISQFIKATIYSCIILALIHFLIVPFWALGIISILVYAALVVSGILFLTDIKRQKQNMLPMFFFIVAALVSSAIGFILSDTKDYWAVIVLSSISVVLLIVCISVLRLDFLRELKKGFHIK